MKNPGKGLLLVVVISVALTVSVVWYESQTAAGVDVVADRTAIQDFALSPSPPVDVPEFNMSIVMMTSILLCVLLLTNSRAQKAEEYTPK